MLPPPASRPLPTPRIAYYISAHGFGHAARSAPVLQTLSGFSDLYIKTEIPADYFHLVGVTHVYIRQPVDVGCVQKNFVEVDRTATLDAYRRFSGQREARLNAEVQWLEEQDIDLVVTDVPAWPLLAGRKAGIPALLLANFTWHDIYADFPEIRGQTDLLTRLEEEYGAATLQILPQCHLDNGLVKNKEEVGLISLKGRDIRARLEEALDTDFTSRKVVFIYFGVFDASQVDWQRLESMSEYLFLTRDPLPHPSPAANLHILDDRFLFPDLIASADVVLTKAGYSTIACALVHGKPVLSCSRDDFIEFTAMKRFLEEHRVGRIIDTATFFQGNWRADLEAVLRLSVEGRVRVDGETDVARIVRRYLGG